MAATYEPIATTTLGSAQASVSFTGISGSFTDLVLIISAGSANTIGFNYVRFNSDSGTNYSATSLSGDGSSATSQRSSNSNKGWLGYWTGIENTIKTMSITHIQNYSNSTTYKSWITRNNNANGSTYSLGTEAAVGLWRSTSAITSMTIYNQTSGTDYNFIAGSTFTLYGIASA